jgi:cytochrome c oxidase assembly factor CtaG
MFTSEPWYPYFTTSVKAWGFTPPQHQQLAGLIIWMPSGSVFSLLAILYFAAWLRALEQRSERIHYSNSLPISDANVKEIVEGANK